MECWLYDLVDEHRKRFKPRDEGALWLTFLAFDDTVTTMAIEGATAHVHERMLINLVDIIDAAGAEAVVFVVPRRNARPKAVDHRIWAELASRVDPRTDVLDLVVIGERSYWSAAERAGAPQRGGR